jgi:type II secretory pathway component GspD/PulD (secretin)|uniref:Type II/III secretion system secretin-like domain-containing protein n=1 Tax=Mesoaciditoga lauensis TaxID=1495039 RepID=A0A7V3RE86_9BACT
MKQIIFITILVTITLSIFGATKVVTESFFEMDLRQALSQLSYDTGETIIADDTVGGYVTIDLKNVTLDKALDLVLLAGGYSWTKINGIYFVSLAAPDSDKFMYFATTTQYKTINYKSVDILSLIPLYMRKYVNVSPNDPYILTVTAPKDMSGGIISLIKTIDVPKREIELDITVVETDENTFRKWERNWGYNSTSTGTASYFSISNEWFTANILTPLGLFSGSFDLNKSTENLKLLSESNVRILNGIQSKIFSKTIRVYQYTLNDTIYYKEIPIGVETTILPTMVGNQIILDISEALFSSENGGQDIPSAVQQGIQTSIIVQLGGRISVAAMSFKSLLSIESKIPVLGDIPLVGKLFTQLDYKDVLKRVVLFVAVKAGE